METQSVTPGGDVWIGIGSALAIWVAVSSLWRGVPGPIAAVGWFAQSWLGRTLALCAWAGAGWHLFCQRP